MNLLIVGIQMLGYADEKKLTEYWKVKKAEMSAEQIEGIKAVVGAWE